MLHSSQQQQPQLNVYSSAPPALGVLQMNGCREHGHVEIAVNTDGCLCALISITSKAEEAAFVVHLMCCVDLQVYFPEHARGRIDLFDLLSDVRPADHVGRRSALKAPRVLNRAASFLHELSRHD